KAALALVAMSGQSTTVTVLRGSRSCSVIDFLEFSQLLLVFQQDLSHHPLISVIQQMAMKYGHAPDDWVGEVKDDVHGAAKRNIDRIQPRRMGEWHAVFCIGQEVDLVKVERM